MLVKVVLAVIGGVSNWWCFELFPVNNASLQIEVNPVQPTVLPKCTFLGADHGKCL